jgi:histidinol phosphatase-like PHP family hydrolase
VEPSDLRCFLEISGLPRRYIEEAARFFHSRGPGSSPDFYNGEAIEHRKAHIASSTLKRYLRLIELPNPGREAIEESSEVGSRLMPGRLNGAETLADWLLLLWRSAPAIDSRILGDFHVHVTQSDGLDRVEDMVRRAQGLGYHWLGLADHAPGTDHPYRITVDGFLRRLEASARAAERVPIRIFQALEVDLAEQGLQEVPAEITDRLDYILVSSHNPDLEISDKYLEALEKAFAFELVRGYAHPFWMLDFHRYRSLIAEAVSLAVAHNVAVELNFYPDSIRANYFLIEEVRRRGGTVILSTDAHHANAMHLMRFAAAFLRERETAEVLNFETNPLQGTVTRRQRTV